MPISSFFAGPMTQALVAGQAYGGRLELPGGSLLTSSLRAPKYEGSLRGSRFWVPNASFTTTVGLATVYTGLAIYNPPTSTVNAVVEKILLSNIVAFGAGAVIGVMTGFNGTPQGQLTALITPAPSKLGSSAVSQIKGLSATTWNTTPTFFAPFSSGLTGAINLADINPPVTVDFDGSLIVSPGGFAAIYTSTASGSGGMAGAILFEEVPTITGT